MFPVEGPQVRDALPVPAPTELGHRSSSTATTNEARATKSMIERNRTNGGFGERLATPGPE
jgi:hypothetical protein